MAIWLTGVGWTTSAVAQDAGAQRRIDTLELLVRRHRADTQTVHDYNELAWRYQQLDPAKADRNARQALKLSRQLGFARGEGKALTLLGATFSIRGQLDSALAYHGQALRLRRALGDRQGVAGVLNNIGIVYLYQGNYPRATRLLIESLRIEEQLGDSVRIGEGLVNLGNIFLELKNYSQADSYYRQFLRVVRDSAARASALDNMSIVAHNTGDNLRAVALAREALALSRRANDPHTITTSLINLGGGLSLLHQYAAAVKAHREALDLAEKLGEQQSIASALVGLGANLSMLEDRQSPVYLERGLAIARQIGSRAEERAAYQALSEWYEHKGDFRRALTYHQRLLALRDTLLNQENTEQVNALRTQYETDKKEQQNRVQALQLSQQRLMIRKRELQLLASLLGAVGALLIAWLVFNRARLRQRLALARERATQQRARAAAVIEAEERERRRIGADLHDGVGQLLSAAKLNLSSLQHDLNLRNPAQQAQLANSLDTLDESLREVRALSHQLVPNALLRQGLVAAVREFLNRMTSAGTLRAELDAAGLDQRLPMGVENIVYRAIQEVVANVVRHAHADQLTIQLVGRPEELSVLIEDNGIGFDVAAAEARSDAGIGLRNLRSRIDYLGGRLDLDSRPGRGTIVTIEVPLNPAAAEQPVS